MFLGIDYSTWWFLVFGAVITGYAILDGFDLGAGALHLFLKKEESRRIALNAIGPVWDGNEVWLVIGGGALFAGFPVAYAAVFSAFYVPFMIFIVGLIYRAVAIEFRSKNLAGLLGFYLFFRLHHGHTLPRLDAWKCSAGHSAGHQLRICGQLAGLL